MNKNSMGLSVYCLLIILMTSCAPSIKRMGYSLKTEAPYSECNIPLYSNAPIDTNQVEILGKMKIGDTGFSTNCNKAQVLEIIRKDACIVGADAINLVDIKEPSVFGSTCYRATALFLKYKESGADRLAFMPVDSGSGSATGKISPPLENIHNALYPPPGRLEYEFGGYFYYNDDWRFSSIYNITSGIDKNKKTSFALILPQVRSFIERNDTIIDGTYRSTGTNSCISAGFFGIFIAEANSNFDAGIQYKSKTPKSSMIWHGNTVSITTDKKLFLHGNYSFTYGIQLLKRLSLTIPPSLHFYSLALTDYTYIHFGKQYLQLVLCPEISMAFTRNFRMELGGGIAINKLHSMPLLKLDFQYNAL